MSYSLTEEGYKKLTGISWSDNPFLRVVRYQLAALVSPPQPQNIFQSTNTTLELIQLEPNQNVKIAFLNALDQNFKQYQKRHPNTNLAPLFEQLILVAQNLGNATLAPALINLGLDIASREVRPTSEDFFNWVTDSLRAVREDFPNGRPIKYSITTIRKIGTVARQHPHLITPEYVEMCCGFVSLALRPTSSQPSRYEQPHERTRRIRIAAENEATNKSIQAAQMYAGSNLNTVVELHKKGKIAIPAIQLFSELCMRALEQTVNAPSQKQSFINEVTTTSILEEIRRIIKSEITLSVRPTKLKLLTYQPTMRPGEKSA